MEEIEFVTRIVKMGKTLHANIPLDFHDDVKDKIGKQVKVILKEI